MDGKQSLDGTMIQYVCMYAVLQRLQVSKTGAQVKPKLHDYPMIGQPCVTLALDSASLAFACYGSTTFYTGERGTVGPNGRTYHRYI